MNPVEPELNLESINASQMEAVPETPDPKTAGEENAIAQDHKRAEVESYGKTPKSEKSMQEIFSS